MRRAVLPALCLAALCLGSSEVLECPQPAAPYSSAPQEPLGAPHDPLASPGADQNDQEDDDIHFIQVRAPKAQAVQRRARTAGAAEGGAAAAPAAAAHAPPDEEPAKGPPPTFVQVGAVESENSSDAELPFGEDIEIGDDFGGAAADEEFLVGAVHESGAAAGGLEGEADPGVPAPENVAGAAAAGGETERGPEEAGGAAAVPPPAGGDAESPPPAGLGEEGAAEGLEQLQAAEALASDSAPEGATEAPADAVAEALDAAPAASTTVVPALPVSVDAAQALDAAPAASTTVVPALPDSVDAAQADIIARNSLLGLLVLVTGSALLAKLAQGGRASATPLRQQVEQVRETTGAEIRSMFGLDGAEGGQAVSPGILARFQGHVVAKPGGVLTAPFSGRQCVSYSASVSGQRTDGVHQPPVAFHEAGVDFAVRLDDDSGVTMSIHRHEASVFDMVAGKFAGEHAFADAPDGWRGFTMAHVGAGAALGAGGSTGGLAAGVTLEFCECALLVGSRVTCVGEAVRNHDGTLSLCPWRPAALPQPPPGGGRGPLGKAVPWLAPSWERGPLRRAAATAGAQPPSPLAGRVLVSDDPELSRQGSA